MHVLAVAQLCLTLCDPVDCSPPGSSIHGILQARILEWAAISSSRGSSQPRDWTRVSSIGRRILHCWATWEVRSLLSFFCVIHAPINFIRNAYIFTVIMLLYNMVLENMLKSLTQFSFLILQGRVQKTALKLHVCISILNGYAIDSYLDFRYTLILINQ